MSPSLETPVFFSISTGYEPQGIQYFRKIRLIFADISLLLSRILNTLPAAV